MAACACLDPSAKNATALPLLGSAAKKKQWLEVGANLECDGYNGEVYLECSGKVPSLEACKASCESKKECESISYFKSGFCSHWGSPCKKFKYNKKVVGSFVFPSGALPAAPEGLPTWTEINANQECNGYDGEVYLQSSRGQVPTLGVCKSISYFKSGWCSHWGTPCKSTRFNKKVVGSLQLTYVKLGSGMFSKINNFYFSKLSDETKKKLQQANHAAKQQSGGFSKFNEAAKLAKQKAALAKQQAAIAKQQADFKKKFEDSYDKAA